MNKDKPNIITVFSNKNRDEDNINKDKVRSQRGTRQIKGVKHPSGRTQTTSSLLDEVLAIGESKSGKPNCLGSVYKINNDGVYRTIVHLDRDSKEFICIDTTIRPDSAEFDFDKHLICEYHLWFSKEDEFNDLKRIDVLDFKTTYWIYEKYWDYKNNYGEEKLSALDKLFNKSK